MNRANDGAAPAPQETCLRQASAPVVGSAFSFVVSDQVLDPQRLLSSAHVKNVHIAVLNAIVEPTGFDPNLTIVLVRKFFDRPPEKQEPL